MCRESKNKTVLKLSVEITLVILRVSTQYISYSILHSTSSKTPEREGAFHHPAFMGIFPTLVTVLTLST